MDKTNIDVFKALKDSKLPTEYYLGYVNFDWQFSVVDYTADCVEYLPFNVFDSAITSLLQIDGQMTLGQIGKVLGLNCSRENVEFVDSAETELLSEAIESMFDFELIERSILDSRFIRLTDKGQECARTSKKILVSENQGFQVFFDMTSHNHKDAKKIF